MSRQLGAPTSEDFTKMITNNVVTPTTMRARASDCRRKHKASGRAVWLKEAWALEKQAKRLVAAQRRDMTRRAQQAKTAVC